MVQRRNLDTQGIGKRAVTTVQQVIENSGHLLQNIDGDVDIGIDGYIRIRKRTKFKKIVKNKEMLYEDSVDTGNLVGVQIKGVSSIPISGSASYYITRADKHTFGVNFGTKEKLNSLKEVWQNFVGPVVLVFVDLSTNNCWWVDLNDNNSYDPNGYSVIVKKSNVFDFTAFKAIKKLGKELFINGDLIDVKTNNGDFLDLSLTDFKKSAKTAYTNLTEKGEFYLPTIHPSLGKITYSRSGWKHITRLNRRKMRIFNSLFLLKVSSRICETVPHFTKVKKGVIRETRRFIKKVDFLTIRANVLFNYRQSSVVQVVLRRVKTFDKIHPNVTKEDEIFFHSVYEPYRKE